MRIAIVYKRLAESGGSERQVMRSCRALLAAGDDVHLFCAQRRADAPEGLVVHRWARPTFGRLDALYGFSRWARRAIRREERRSGRFDVTHAFGRTEGQDVIRVGGGCHRTYLDLAHGLSASAWIRPLLRVTPHQRLKASFEDRILRAPGVHVITNSRMTRDDLLFRTDIPPDHMHVVPNGVDLDRFRPDGDEPRERTRSRCGLTAEDEVVLFLGTGYARKGLGPALRAVARLAPDRPQMQLLVVGKASRPERWERLAETLGVRERTIFLGARSDPEALYRAADVFVLPTAYDPAANATLEALASGVPVVTSRRDGSAEVIEDGVAGTVVPAPAHPHDIARAIAAWLDRQTDPEGRARVRAVARATAERHPAEASATAIREVYRRIVTERRGATSAAEQL